MPYVFNQTQDWLAEELDTTSLALNLFKRAADIQATLQTERCLWHTKMISSMP